MTELTAQIFTPRWGHEDTYKFELTRDAMTISHGPRKAKCLWVENRDPHWKGEPLERILSNDHMYAPAILPRLLEHLWSSWRSGELKDAAAQKELTAVIKWLNKITAAKPKTSYWRKYF